MRWAGKQHPVETAAEFAAPLLLAGAVGWSVRAAGLTQLVVVAAAVGAFLIGALAMKLLGHRDATVLQTFEPIAFDAESTEHGELLLDEPAVEEELLLDDPLTEIADTSRVVRLFAKQEPTPGELVARIEDFLGDGGRRIVPQSAANVPLPDASAALQAALANIRSSLK